MKFRKPRIAWSVVWGVLAVLIVVLWMRSYGDTEPAEFIGITVWAMNGTLRLYDPFPPPATLRENEIYFGDASIGLPIWLLATGAIAFATLPWLFRRFSLLTLLVATTLVAVVLGLVSYAARN